MSEAIDALLRTAAGQVGYLEKASASQLDDPTGNAGYGNYTKFARDLDALGNFYNFKKQGQQYCDIFVDWCFVTTFGESAALRLLCQPLRSAGAGCQFSAGYYRSAGRFYKTGQRGDQIFFTFDGKTVAHTGLVEKTDEYYVYTIEGNTSGASGVIANGGGVCRKRYPRMSAQIYGYGRPDYSIVEEDFMNGKEIYEKLNEYLRVLPCPPAMADELAEAVDLGITDGTRPMELIPRYQAAIMAKRAVEKMKE